MGVGGMCGYSSQIHSNPSLTGEFPSQSVELVSDKNQPAVSGFLDDGSRPNYEELYASAREKHLEAVESLIVAELKIAMLLSGTTKEQQFKIAREEIFKAIKDLRDVDEYDGQSALHISDRLKAAKQILDQVSYEDNTYERT